MLNVDLSTLRGRELRQLLETTRQRGQAALRIQESRADDAPAEAKKKMTHQKIVCVVAFSEP